MSHSNIKNTSNGGRGFSPAYQYYDEFTLFPSDFTVDKAVEIKGSSHYIPITTSDNKKIKLL